MVSFTNEDLWGRGPIFFCHRQHGLAEGSVSSSPKLGVTYYCDSAIPDTEVGGFL